MARKLPWKKAAEAASASSSLPETPTQRRTAAPSSASRARPAPAAVAALNSSDPLRSPSTSPPPEPPRERYMTSGDDRYRIVEDELLQTAQRFTTHLHRAEYSRLKLIAKSKNDAAIREIERPVVGPLTSDARKRRDRARRLSKQRSVLSTTAESANQDGENGENGDDGASPWVGTNLRGLLNAPRAETRSLAPQTTATSSLTKAAVGHRPLPPLSTPHPPPSRGTSFATPASMGRARNATPGSSSNITPSSVPRRRAKEEPDADTAEDDDMDFDDPFGLNRRRLDRQKSREKLKKPIRATPTNTPSSSDTMPSFA